MAITAKDVMELRKQTDCGMMECKKALTEADGNFEKAIEILRERGLATAAKKASRTAAEGMVYADYCPQCKVGVVIDVTAETDFVAKNDKCVAFVKEATQVIMKQNPADVEALLTLKATGSEQTIAEMLQEKVLTIGENIQIRRFERMEGACVAYVHAGGKIGVLVNFDTDLAAKPEFVAYGKDVAMQIAALNTPYLNESEVPAEIIEHEKEVMRQQVINEGKPEQIADKIVMGKIGKFYKENCLLDQEFVKDNKINIKQYTQNTAKELGGSIEIKRFVRFEKGEGIEKRQDDFAAEVASMVK